jgi:hypothetical protein
MRPGWTFSVFQSTGTILPPIAIIPGKKKKGGKNTTSSPSPTRQGSYYDTLPKSVDLVVPERQGSSGGAEEGVIKGIAEAVGDEQERDVFIGDDVELTFEDAFQI